ncbi:MAG: rhodanese-like domain-containing protein [Gammaproteobacteria bacterium]|nr:rhodanese-like domain-containing protein [Gammaproteobacteria bacterium]
MKRGKFPLCLARGYPVLFVAVILLAGLAPGAPGSGHPSVSPQSLHQRITRGDAPVILDVRSRQEFASGHIPGAINLPVTELRQRVGELSAYKNAELVVHCEVGPRAGMASRILEVNGFSGLVELEGHMRGWRNAGLPTER